MTQRLAVRIWLPDRPGMLAAVATRIAGLEGNVIGLEVLERSGGVAVDELMVELPAEGLDRELSTRLQAIEGAGVEEVRIVPDDAEERGLQVIAAAISILETANATASLAALIGLVDELFDAEWSALVDLRTETCVDRQGDVPPVDWLLAFLAGARSAPAAGATSGSGVMSGELIDSGLALCIGRSVAFRGREHRELEMLVRVADRMCRPLRADRIPQSWVAGRQWPGS
jgi:ACT domain